MLKRILAVLLAAALLLGGAVPAAAQSDSPSSGFRITEEMISQIIAWLIENDPEQLIELQSQLTGTATTEPEPNPEPEHSPEETLSFWQQPGRIEAVDAEYACLVGSYHHTCTLWVNGSGDQVSCSQAGCDPTG